MRLEFIPEDVKKDHWEIHVEFMYGDDDLRKEEIVECISREETEEKLKILMSVPDRYPDEKYSKWCRSNKDWLGVPKEPPNYDWFAEVYSFEVFYWDQLGKKYRIKVHASD